MRDKNNIDGRSFGPDLILEPSKRKKKKHESSFGQNLRPEGEAINPRV
jgi:hypothetical protein